VNLNIKVTKISYHWLQAILFHCVSFLLLLSLSLFLPVHFLVSPFDTARKSVNHFFCQSQRSCQRVSPRQPLTLVLSCSARVYSTQSKTKTSTFKTLNNVCDLDFHCNCRSLLSKFDDQIDFMYSLCEILEYLVGAFMVTVVHSVSVHSTPKYQMMGARGHGSCLARPRPLS